MNMIEGPGAMVDVELDIKYPEAAARSAIYGMLSHAFCYPGQNSSEGGGAASRAETREYIGRLPYRCDAVETTMDDVLQSLNGAPGIAETYTALFDNCTGRALIALREAEYVADNSKSLWEDLVRFYEHFGVNYSVDDIPLWPDHIVVELDMLCYLSFLEASGGANRDVFIRAQHDFIKRHPKRWISELSKSLSQAPDSGVYSEIAGILAEFIEAEEDYLTQVALSA
jgi:DMSO reductase family type II enzyme chaperone